MIRVGKYIVMHGAMSSMAKGQPSSLIRGNWTLFEQRSGEKDWTRVESGETSVMSNFPDAWEESTRAAIDRARELQGDPNLKPEEWEFPK